MTGSHSNPISRTKNLIPNNDSCDSELNTAQDSGVPGTPDARATDKRDKQMARRVDKIMAAIDPGSVGHCSIENTVKERGVQYAHVVGRFFRHHTDKMERLEWALGFAYRTLNLDTSLNVFPLGASIHIMFDSLAFFLVPDEEVLQSIWTYVKAKNGNKVQFGPGRQTLGLPAHYRLDANKAQKHSCQLIPLPDRMNKVWLNRERLDHDSEAAPVVHHSHPYTAMPLIESHIHPAFAIVFAASIHAQISRKYATEMNPSKDHTTKAATYSDWLTVNPRIQLMIDIYDAWMSFEVPRSFANAVRPTLGPVEAGRFPDRRYHARSQVGGLSIEPERAPKKRKVDEAFNEGS